MINVKIITITEKSRCPLSTKKIKNPMPEKRVKIFAAAKIICLTDVFFKVL